MFFSGSKQLDVDALLAPYLYLDKALIKEGDDGLAARKKFSNNGNGVPLRERMLIEHIADSILKENLKPENPLTYIDVLWIFSNHIEVKMSNTGKKICGVSVGAGSLGGAMTGFALGVWTHVSFIQPAFASIDALSESQASGITAAIALFGGMEAFIGVGICAGVVAVPLGAGILYGAGAAIVGACSNIPCPSFTFFSRTRSNTNQPPAALSEVTVKSDEDPPPVYSTITSSSMA